MLRETTGSILNSNLPAVRIFEAVDGKEALAPKLLSKLVLAIFADACLKLS
jgi:hypothetical protein